MWVQQSTTGRVVERLEQEHNNLRATMEWSLDPAHVGYYRMEMAYRLGEALTEFWKVRGFNSEAQTFLERVLAYSKE